MGSFPRRKAPEASRKKSGPEEFVGRTISRIEAQSTIRSSSGRRVNVYAGDQFAFALDGELAFALGLRAGLELTRELVERIQAQTTLTQAVRTALDYNKHRPRSAGEIRKRLEEEGFSPGVIEATIQKLTEAGILDDARLAQQWVMHRERLKPRGNGLLKRELASMGIAGEEAQAALPDGEKELENAVQALVPWVRRHGLPTERLAEGKAIAHLQRRGFSYGVARAALMRFPLDEE